MTPSLRNAVAVALVLLLASPVPAGDAPSGPVLYTDANGATRMVETLEQVPQAFRSRARVLGGERVEYQQRTTTITPERAARARARAEELARTPERRREPVIFYSAGWCGYCARTRTYLVSKGIPFEERDIDDPDVRRELRAKTGSTMVPVVQYEDRIVTGWNPRAIDALGL
jgi:glutaredoxin